LGILTSTRLIHLKLGFNIGKEVVNFESQNKLLLW